VSGDVRPVPSIPIRGPRPAYAPVSPGKPLKTTSPDTKQRLLRRISRDESGAALVEFALVIPLLLVLLLGMLDFGKAFNYWNDTTHLSAEGARWAAVNINPGDGATLQDSIRGQADTPELRNGGTDAIDDPVQVCIDFPDGTSNVGDPVKVTVTAHYNFLNYIGVKTGITDADISGSSTMRLEQVPDAYSEGCS
jgi:Flp pilus assembly protein TadG